MPLESGTYISDLVASNPVGATDPKSQGDDHIRLIKSTIKNTFPNIAGQVTASHTLLNLLSSTTNDRVLRVTGGVANMGQLTSGMFPTQVVPDAALSNNVPLKNVSNTFLADQIISLTGGQVRTNNSAAYIAWSVRANAGAHGWVTFTESGVADRWIVGIEGNDSTLYFATGNPTAYTKRISFAAGGSIAVSNGLTVSSGGAAITGNSTISGTLTGLTGITSSGTASFAALNVSGTATFSNTLNVTGTLALAGTISGNVSTPNTSAAEVGFKGAPHRDISASASTAASDAGGTIKMVSGSGTLTLNSNPPASSVVVLYNKSGNNWTITASGTLRWATTGGTGNRTLASGGLAVAYHDGNGDWVINGGGLS